MLSGRRRIVTVAVVLAAVCLVAGEIWLKARDDRGFFDTAALLSRFPVEEATVFRVDFAALRRGGFLGGPKAALEPEYREFLEGTGFDYRRDLDLAVASISKSGNFFIARGRFDWNRLREYSAKQGGSCYQQLCRMPGSTPERHISFLPLRNDAIAIAVSSDDLAAARLTKAGPRVNAQFPAAPVWISVAGAALRDRNAVSPGMRLMLSALTNADRIVITVGPQSAGIEAHMEAACRTVDDARVLASQLRNVTTLLRDAMSRDREAQSDELARTLIAGRFDQTDRRVEGRWPVGKSVFESLTAGI